MAKAIIWWLSLLALSLLLFGCTAPEEVVDDGLGGEVENPVVNDAEAVDEWVAPVPEARPKVCDLLTVQDIASTCQNAQNPTLASEQREDPDGFVDSCWFTINRIPGTEPRDPVGVADFYLEYMGKTDNVEFKRNNFERIKKSSEKPNSFDSEVIEVNDVGDYAFSYNSLNVIRKFEVAKAAKGDHYGINLVVNINKMFRTPDGGLADFSTICTYDEQKALAQLIVSRIQE